MTTQAFIRTSDRPTQRRAWCAAVWLVLGLGLTQIANAEDWIRIDQPDAALRAQLPPDALDYGRFIWLPAASLPERARSPRRIQHRANPFAMPIDGRWVDPITVLPPARAQKSLADEADFFLIQFPGPLQAEWLEALRTQGVEPVHAVAPFGYLVWARPGDLPTTTPRSGQTQVPMRFVGQLHESARRPALTSERSEQHPHSRALIKAQSATDIAQALHSLGIETGSFSDLGSGLHALELVAYPELFPTLLEIPGVLSIQQVSQDAGPRGEMSNQSVVGLQSTGQTLQPGYQNWLNQVALDGSGVVVAVIDGGIRQSHQDPAGQFVPCIRGNEDLSSCNSSNNNHGTNVAGAISGTGLSNQQFNGFLRGQGVAPGERLIEQRYPPFLSSGPGGLVPGGMLTIFAESALSGAVLANNSWGPSGTPQGYDIPSREVDLITRNALPGADRDFPILPIWSIMNGNGDRNGLCAPSSLGAPDEARNPGCWLQQFGAHQRLSEPESVQSLSKQRAWASL